MSVNVWDDEVTKETLNKYYPIKSRLKTYLFNINNIENIVFPCIIKPSICGGSNKNVKLINNINELYEYIQSMNKNEKYIIQEFFKSKYEIGVLYEKIPIVNTVNVTSIVLKQSMSNDWKALMCGNIKNNEETTCTNLTEELKDTSFIDQIKQISSKIPNFNAGRYDIGFNSYDDLNKGYFKIYELNGVMGFDLRNMIEKNYTFKNVITYVYYSFRWLIVRLLIGFLNIISFKVSPFYLLSKIPFSIQKTIECNDYEFLFQPSPA